MSRPETPVVVVFDVDECLGSFDQPIQLQHEIMESPQFSKEQRMTLLQNATEQIEEALFGGNLRPGIGRVFRFLLALKEGGQLDHVVLFTNASNEQGWVDYLGDLLEGLTKAPELISTIIARETEGRNMRTPAHFERQAKHLSDLARFIGVPEVDLTRVIMFDDHIDSIVPNHVAGANDEFIRVAYQVPEQEIYAKPDIFEPFFASIAANLPANIVADLRAAVTPSPDQHPQSAQNGDIKHFIVPLVHFFLRNRVPLETVRRALKEQDFSPQKILPRRGGAHPSKTQRRRRHIDRRRTVRHFH